MAQAPLRYVRGKSVDPANYTHLPLEVAKSIENLKQDVFDHPGVKVLNAFGERLNGTKLSREQIRIILASEGLFILEIPPGILALASRLTDENFEATPFQATGMAARILFAAIDEFGLNAMNVGLLPSHHQLYLDMAAHWDISEEELLDDRYIVPAGRALAKVARDYYRKRPMVEALGFHVANETSAPLDFGVFLRMFQANREGYGLKVDDPILDFLHVHEDVEVSHREMGVEMVQMYTQGRPEDISRARDGVFAFMDAYEKFFAELDAAVFPPSAADKKV